MNSHRGCRWVPATRDNCLGAEYPPFRACPVNLTRREAMAADVVMVNDHHFFADLVVRERGMAAPLPTVRVFSLLASSYPRGNWRRSRATCCPRDGGKLAEWRTGKAS